MIAPHNSIFLCLEGRDRRNHDSQKVVNNKTFGLLEVDTGLSGLGVDSIKLEENQGEFKKLLKVGKKERHV
jgi:hypothetical protein